MKIEMHSGSMRCSGQADDVVQDQQEELSTCLPS